MAGACIHDHRYVLETVVVYHLRHWSVRRKRLQLLPAGAAVALAEYVKTLRCREYLFIFLKITAKGWYSGHQHARQVRHHNATVDLQLEEARQSLA